MIFYFTGTGNCLWTAKRLGSVLKQPIQSIASIMSKKEIEVEDDLIGFVFPTYMNDIPWIVKDFLLRLHIKNSSYCFAVMTSNNGKSGKAACNIDKALQKNHAKLSACFDLQMPGNCIESSDESNQERLQRAPSAVDNIAEKIKQKIVNFSSKGEAAGKDFVSSSYFYGTKSLKRLTIMNAFCVTDACTGCGICEKVCPTHNIEMQDKRAVHADHCAACYACLHWCPVHATLPKFFFIKNRKQYTHPDITLHEIIDSRKAEI